MASERERYNSCFPFPPIANGVLASHSLGNLSLQAFGNTAKDLEIDFNRKHPHVVTEILCECTRDVNDKTLGPDFFWNLAVGVRIECLLVLATLGGRTEVSTQLRCSHGACGQPMEMRLSLEALAAVQRQADEADFLRVTIDDQVLRIRKPTGMDQLEWLKRSYPDENAAVKAMLRSLLAVECQIPDPWMPSINEAMEGYDPLVNFEVAASCPRCGRKGRYELDLEALALDGLQHAQLDLIGTIHRLASRFHWSEGQILSIPPWRRSRYLALIEREELR